MKLKTLHLKGFKSVDADEGAMLDFGDITVLLGANGVGKSNLVSFFNMLNYMVTGALQNYIAERGYADSFLHFGSKETRSIWAKLEFEGDNKENSYEFTLTYAAGDILIFTEEKVTYIRSGSSNPYNITLNPGSRDTDLISFVQRTSEKPQDKTTVRVILNLLKLCRVYHFHDTSPNAKIRGKGYIEDYQFLKHDAGNLAAFLYRLKNNNQFEPHYNKIVRYIQKAVPTFRDFDLAPDGRNRRYISLNWRENINMNYLLGPHQISDGSLRFMALATLLLQPTEFLPKVIILDEPELGLHPSAIGYLAGMIKAASIQTQIIIATQSQRLIDEFELEDIVIVERSNESNSTIFLRKNPNDLTNWLEEYSLSELWEKNVIGGQP
jgi:predicted ATPase